MGGRRHVTLQGTPPGVGAPAARDQAHLPRVEAWQAVTVIVVTEHRAGDEFGPLGRGLLAALSVADGFVDGRLCRSPDEPDVWLIVSSWRDVGSMRRGFGTFDAKVAAAPVMHSAVDRVSAFEVLAQADVDGVRDFSSDRA